MPATRGEHRTAAREAGPDGVAAAIGEHVLGALGRPADAYRVVVRRLWDDHYRVNVLVGTDAVSTTVAHSYFVVTGDDGAVSGTTPVITRRYDPPAA